MRIVQKARLERFLEEEKTMKGAADGKDGEVMTVVTGVGQILDRAMD